MRSLHSQLFSTVCKAVALCGPLLCGTTTMNAQIAACATPFVAHDDHKNDAGIAVGRTQVVAMEHDYVKVFGKCGGLLYQESLDGIDPLLGEGLWFSVGATAKGMLIDPEAEYDVSTGRFFLMSQTHNDPSETESFFLAYSDVQDATVWHTFKFPFPIQGFELDSCNLAVDDTHVWMNGVGIFFSSTEPIVCIKKTDLFASSAPPYYTGDSASLGVSPSFSNLADSHSYDAAPQYSIDSVHGTGPGTSVLRIYAFKLSSQNVVSMSQPYVLSVPDFTPPIGPVQQLNGGSFYGTGFNQGWRVWSAVYRNGSLWATHMIGDPGGSGRILTRWYEIRMNLWDGTESTPGFPIVRQTGTIDPANGLSTLMPSIAVDAVNNALVSYNLSGSTQRISINRSSRCASDPLNTMPTFSQIYISTASLGNPGSTGLAWNDFSGSGPDPVIPNRFYTHNAAVQSVNQLRTWISRFDGMCGMDYSGDGSVGSSDAAMFFQAYLTGDPSADVASSDTIDGDDVQAFVELSDP